MVRRFEGYAICPDSGRIYYPADGTTSCDVPMEATITLPKSLLSVIKVREPDLDRFVRRILAVELYREGRLSLGKAAEVAGARNKWEMIMLLDEKGVPVDYSGEDAKADLETLRKHQG